MDAVIDPVIIGGLRQLRSPDKPEPVANFIDLFFCESPEPGNALSNAGTDKSIDPLSRFTSAASALKGSTGNLGARNGAALEAYPKLYVWVGCHLMSFLSRASPAAKNRSQNLVTN